MIKNPDNLVIQQTSGNYYVPSVIRETLVQLCNKAGVEYRGTHVFRHTHAVLLLESGASLKYVAARLGHEKITTTADYLHITEKIEKDELDKFAAHVLE
ncbi:tyrosine-type recombinase/integrase [Domibacillus aminovorans]|nr:tyrosine-type recombinase/integrase [Domibacillus aminovorans]